MPRFLGTRAVVLVNPDAPLMVKVNARCLDTQAIARRFPTSGDQDGLGLDRTRFVRHREFDLDSLECR